jgi:hypothetical protein
MGGLWLVSTMIGLALEEVQGSNSKDSFWPLAIPLAGPFVTIGSASAEQMGTFVLVMDGVMQCAGLAMFIAGFAAQKEVLVYTAGSAQVAVLPTFSNNSAGLGVVGSY